MRQINRAESWERAYESFQQINFSAWDFNSIKESMLDHLKVYYPEDFNDYIESSEFVMLLEIFAYLGEMMAYRLDLNAHENFLSTAQRKESVLRLAKLLSYNPSRNIPARGLVKLTSVVTTERVLDSAGLDLTNRVITWNDSNNPNWKEQFILVLNRCMEQEFGTVRATDRIQNRGILFEQYTLKNNPLQTQTIPFNVSVSGVSYPMEAVSAELNEFGPVEKRPRKNQRISVIYSNDGLGDASINTGFFFLVKQGRLGRLTADFDGVTPNQTFDVNVVNCNETDVWLNNINPDTGEIVSENDVTSDKLLGEWEKVDLANSQNVIFNTSPDKNKYEVETLADDKFRLVFGDGTFASVPSGRFEIWYRVSANTDAVIPTSALQNVNLSLNYRDSTGREHTLTTTVSLVAPIQNASPSEDIDRIRRIAPAVYYTQDRMVNGRDYNQFMLQDNSILKLRAVNRTFAGDSKYIAWKDPKEYYDNVKIFGDDLSLYFNTNTTTYPIISELPSPDGADNIELKDALFLNHIQPLLSTEQFFLTAVIAGTPPRQVRTIFTPIEKNRIYELLQTAIENTPTTFWAYYTASSTVEEGNFFTFRDTPTTDDWLFTVRSIDSDNRWQIVLNHKNMVVNSSGVNFFITNGDERVTEFDTLNPKYDNIVILKANIGYNSNGVLAPLSNNYPFRVLRQYVFSNGEDIATPSTNDLLVLPEDDNQDGIPDNISLAYLIGPNDYVYFTRSSINDNWVLTKTTDDIVALYESGELVSLGLLKRERGRSDLNFLWMHRTPRYHLIDPAASNIIDTFVIPRGYYGEIRRWLANESTVEPTKPSPSQLRADYGYLLNNKMISDTVVLHPGQIKVIFGNKASPELQASIKIIQSQSSGLTTNQIKTRVVDLVNEFFDIQRWEFGETFYFSELSAFIHTSLPSDVDAVVLVPKSQYQVFGDLQRIVARDDEIIQPNITVSDIEIVNTLNPTILRQSQ